MTVTSADLHRVFRQLLLGLALPGRPRTVPFATGEDDAASLVVSSAWDDGTRDNGRTDPRVVYLEGAVTAIAASPRGTEEEPEGGATLVVIVPDGCAASRAPTPVRLTGPGVDGQLETEVPLGTDVLEARAAACAQWPCGVDIVVVGPGPRLVGLPRTTVVEVAG